MENLEIIREIHDQIKDSDESRFRELLNQLKSIQVSYEILKETKIAKTIKRLEKKYPGLKYPVRDLIDRWRAVAKLKKKSEDKPIHLEDSRNKVVKMLMDLLKDRQISIEIEEELHKFGSSSYASKFRSLKFNLSKNEELRAKVVNRVISPEELVKMNPKDMASEESKMERKKIEKDLTEGRRSDWNAVNNAPKGGMFKCKRCGSDKTLTHQMQTRSADEPMTT
jgi:DNA-directed RNA polymerase subunit M/transcription elongation factor TFIIS